MKRRKITTLRAYRLLLDVERALAPVDVLAAPDTRWTAARSALRQVRDALDEHVLAAMAAKKVR